MTGKNERGDMPQKGRERHDVAMPDGAEDAEGMSSGWALRWDPEALEHFRRRRGGTGGSTIAEEEVTP
ncbi:MAG: hypothetical protein PHU43_00395 [Candidatus Bipolaricaulis sp.]|nr:hypothetical protein [Candidatus Bipolaricaulis sp.]